MVDLQDRNLSRKVTYSSRAAVGLLQQHHRSRYGTVVCGRLSLKEIFLLVLAIATAASYVQMQDTNDS